MARPFGVGTFLSALSSILLSILLVASAAGCSAASDPADPPSAGADEPSEQPGAGGGPVAVEAPPVRAVVGARFDRRGADRETNTYGYREQTGTHELLVLFAGFDDAPLVHGKMYGSRRELVDGGDRVVAGGVDDELLGVEDVSLADYYEEASGGRLEVEPEVDREVVELEREFRDHLGTAGRLSGAGELVEAVVDGYHARGGDVLAYDSFAVVVPVWHRWSACPKGPGETPVGSKAYERCFGREAGGCSGSECEAECGNGAIERAGEGWSGGSEECDDGNDSELDACTSDCRYAHPFVSTGGFVSDGRFVGPQGERSGRRRFMVLPTAQELVTGSVSAHADDADGDGDPFEYGDGQVDASKSTVGVVCHEFGHILGLPDTYAARSPRPMGGWDLMAKGGYHLPGLALPHRAALGWVDEAALATFDLASGSFEGTATLAAGAAPGGGDEGAAGVRIRLGPGWYLFAEYRRGTDGRLADPPASPVPRAPKPGEVAVTEFVAEPYARSAERRPTVTAAQGTFPYVDDRSLQVGQTFRQPQIDSGRRLTIEPTETDGSAEIAVRNGETRGTCTSDDACEDLGDVLRLRSAEEGAEQGPDLERAPAGGESGEVVPGVDHEIRATVRNVTDETYSAVADFYALRLDGDEGARRPALIDSDIATVRPGENTITGRWRAANDKDLEVRIGVEVRLKTFDERRETVRENNRVWEAYGN